MIRIAFDSDTINDLPVNAIAFTYSDLVPDTATLAHLETEFPFGLVLIDRHGDPTGTASILDVETGLHTPAQAPAWYDAKKTAGVPYLTIYANASTYPQVNAAMGSRVFSRWIADYGTLHITGYAPGKRPALVQFANEPMLGFHCDASVIWDDKWHPELPPPVQSSTWAGSAPLLASLSSAVGELNDVINTIASHQ